MTRRLLTLCLALLVPAGAFATEEEAEDPDLPRQGAEAPSFSLPTYNPDASGGRMAGTMFLVGDDADDKDTKLIVVSFMASYCKPCKKELPFLQKTYAELKDKGLRIVGVAIDKDPEGQKIVTDLVAENKVTFPVVKDQYNLTARRYLGNKFPLPSVFMLDKTGKILFVSRGYNEEISKKFLASVYTNLGVTPPADTEEKKAEPAPEPKPDAKKGGKKTGGKK